MIFTVRGISKQIWNKRDVFHELFNWLLVFIISDIIFLGFVSTTYIAYKEHLYKYAHLKSIICSILLVFNFCFLGYGGYIISKVPSEIAPGQEDLNS